MAEAVVEDRPQQALKRFYCHFCNVEIENVTNVSIKKHESCVAACFSTDCQKSISEKINQFFSFNLLKLCEYYNGISYFTDM